MKILKALGWGLLAYAITATIFSLLYGIFVPYKTSDTNLFRIIQQRTVEERSEDWAIESFAIMIGLVIFFYSLRRFKKEKSDSFPIRPLERDKQS